MEKCVIQIVSKISEAPSCDVLEVVRLTVGNHLKKSQMREWDTLLPLLREPRNRMKCTG